MARRRTYARYQDWPMSPADWTTMQVISESGRGIEAWRIPVESGYTLFSTKIAMARLMRRKLIERRSGYYFLTERGTIALAIWHGQQARKRHDELVRRASALVRDLAGAGAGNSPHNSAA